MIKQYRAEEYHIAVYGSAASGLSVKGDSDLDINIVLDTGMDDLEGQAREECRILDHIYRKVISKEFNKRYDIKLYVTASFGPHL